jgi:hypothetical protein
MYRVGGGGGGRENNGRHVQLGRENTLENKNYTALQLKEKTANKL